MKLLIMQLSGFKSKPVISIKYKYNYRDYSISLTWSEIFIQIILILGKYSCHVSLQISKTIVSWLIMNATQEFKHVLLVGILCGRISGRMTLRLKILPLCLFSFLKGFKRAGWLFQNLGRIIIFWRNLLPNIRSLVAKILTHGLCKSEAFFVVIVIVWDYEFLIN
jgi:hypothetical protein